MKPFTSSTIYLDNSSGARPSARAVSEMNALLANGWANPSSPHAMGQRSNRAIEEAFQALYQLLGAKKGDLLLPTASGAEAVCQVLFGACEALALPKGRNQLLVASIDEAPSILSASRLQAFGCVSKLIPCSSSGRIEAEAVADLMTPRTALVSLPWAHGLTGVVQPVAEISEVCRQRGVWLHLDATHALGKLSADLEDLGADLITFHGAQWHAPPGTGGLWIREGLELPPLIPGKGLDLPSLAALGEAAREALEARDFVALETARLRNRLEERVSSGCPRALVLFSEQERLPHVTAIAFQGISNEALLFSLSRRGLCASIGGGAHQQIARVLEASGIGPKLAHAAISFSLSRETSEEEVDRAAEILIETAAKMSRYSEGIDGL